MRTFLLLLVFTFLQVALSQSSLDTLDAETLFFKGRELAFNGQRDSARILLNAALAKSPDYADIRILLARTYAWDQRREEARQELQKVLAAVPNHPDALTAAVDVEMWDEKYAAALAAVNRSLRYFPNDESLLIKRATIYRELDRDQEALITISILEDLNRSNPDLPALRESIKTKGVLNNIGALTTFDRFSQRYGPQQLVSLYYSRTTPYGIVFGRLNGADRFSTLGLQAEVDAYIPLTGGLYSFLNYGYSGSPLFPQHRFGAELFFKLPVQFEGSVGVRHLDFGSRSAVSLWTGTLGYYWENFWFSVRPYITSGSAAVSRSGSLTARRYIGTEGDFVSFRFGGGISPDESRFQDTVGAAVFTLASTTIGLGYRLNYGISSVFDITLDVTDQELPNNTGIFMAIYSLTVGYRYKF